MAKTIQDVLGNHTPVSNSVVMSIGLVKGAVACKIFYTSNLNDRVCRMGLTRLAKELGIEKSTASKTIKWLQKEGYIDQVKAFTHTEPAHYRCTQKFYDLAGGVDLINTPVDDINTPVDLINQEKESEKESKKESTTTRTRELLNLINENFGPMTKPLKTDVFATIKQYGIEAVSRAVDITLVDRANGKPHTWGYVKGILTKPNGGKQNGTSPNVSNNRNKNANSKTRRPVEPDANARAIAKLAKARARTGSNGT